ncbi:lysogeny establishment protein [Salmonella enterica]|nr:lysogeny establishment protein [Salmonella enterica]EHK5999365.1 lysogeny establishment protein [Salmonella enterica]EIF5124584.1 lysogeny establishment protein [Salmonella enterica]EIF5348760.1 lysogeny establishment protein [Salmonella enterica]EIF5657357.1 lysogeny establishment protein [Salmonella enterica]
MQKAFNIDGKTVYLASGRANGAPVVVVGLRLSEDMPDLASITVEFPMKSDQGAQAFVSNATDETARRGLDKLVAEYGELISMVNNCLSRSAVQSQLMASQGKVR